MIVSFGQFAVAGSAIARTVSPCQARFRAAPIANDGTRSIFFVAIFHHPPLAMCYKRVMRKPYGPLFQRVSRLREDNSPANRTHGELFTARQNAKASIAFGEALAASFKRFEESSAATRANRIGKPPPRDVIPATNASSLYNGTDEPKPRKR
jgi:hypothetical protein